MFSESYRDNAHPKRLTERCFVSNRQRDQQTRRGTRCAADGARCSASTPLCLGVPGRSAVGARTVGDLSLLNAIDLVMNWNLGLVVLCHTRNKNHTFQRFTPQSSRRALQAARSAASAPSAPTLCARTSSHLGAAHGRSHHHQSLLSSPGAEVVELYICILNKDQVLNTVATCQPR